MEKGHYGQYSGNARHSRTPVTKRNYRSYVADDAAHIHYLEEDMKYDKKHHSPFKKTRNSVAHQNVKSGDEKFGETLTEKEIENFVPTFETSALTPDIQYTRDLGIDQGTPGTAGYIPGRRYYAENMQPGVDIGHRLNYRPGYRQSFSSVSGDLNAYPTNPFITRDYNEFGDEISRDSELGKVGYNGMIGRSFSQEEVKEMQDRYDRYMAPKRKAEQYFESKKS